MEELYWILLLTILLAGVVRGVYAAVRQLYGYSNPYLFGEPETVSKVGVLPSAVVQAGVSIFVITSLALRTNSSVNGEAVGLLVSLLAGSSGVICLVQTTLRNLPFSLKRNAALVVSDLFMSLFFWFVGGKIIEERDAVVMAAVLGGLLVGLCEILAREVILENRVGRESAELFPFWMLSLLYINTPEVTREIVVVGVLASIPFILIAIMFNHIVTLWLHFISKIVHRPFLSLFTVIRCKTMICGDCLRYSTPLRSRYQGGKRFCEYCQSELEFTQDSGKLVVVFGNMALEPAGRVFILSDVQHELWEQQQIDVSEIYIDVQSCQNHLLERFIAYLLHTPPKGGTRSVKVFYQGQLEALPAYLKNTLQNNFECIEPFTPEAQRIRNSVKKTLPTYRHTIKAPAPLLRKESPEKKLHRRFFAGAVMGGILGVISGHLLLLASHELTFEGRNSLPCILLFLTGAWILSACVLGGRVAKKHSGALFNWCLAISILTLIGTVAVPNLLKAIRRGYGPRRTRADLRSIGTAPGSYAIDSQTVEEKARMMAKFTAEGRCITSFYYAGLEYDRWTDPACALSAKKAACSDSSASEALGGSGGCSCR